MKLDMALTPEPLPRRSTITDVARLADVSIKTVSRVVRQEPNVSERTKEKVRTAMEALSYRPTIAARSTVSARSFLIGLVFDNPNPAYTLDLLRGAQETAREQGYHLVVEPIDGSNGDAGRMIADLVVQSNLAGLIIPPPMCDNPSVLEAISRIDRSFARIAPSVMPEFGLNVAMDDVAAARTMTEHLLGLGHRRIGFVMGRKGTATTAKRLQGFRDAMAAADEEVADWQVEQGNFSLRSGVIAGEQLLDRADRPTAIFASNDEMAAGVLMAAHRRGLEVPRDLSVAGFDDSVTASAMWPPLTTIRQPVFELAALAAQRIIDHQRAEDTSPGTRQLDFELIVRESTGPAPAA